MEKYLTSAQTLERLCETEPDKPIKYGIGKLLAGIGLIGAGSGTGLLGWKMKEIVTEPYDAIGLGIGITMEIILGGATLGSLGYGSHLLADGIISLGKPLGIHLNNDGSVYHRNGGFTDKPSIYDKKFGSKVTPVEHVQKLNSIDKGFALVNGIYVTNTDVETGSTTNLMPMVTHVGNTNTITFLPIPDEEYTVVLNGELKGQPIKLFTITKDEEFAEALDKTRNSVIYVMGPVDKENGIDVEKFGDAFEYNKYNLEARYKIEDKKEDKE